MENRTLYNSISKLKRYYGVVDSVSVLDGYFSGVLTDDEYCILRDSVEYAQEHGCSILEVCGFTY